MLIGAGFEPLLLAYGAFQRCQEAHSVKEKVNFLKDGKKNLEKFAERDRPHSKALACACCACSPKVLAKTKEWLGSDGAATSTLRVCLGELLPYVLEERDDFLFLIFVEAALTVFKVCEPSYRKSVVRHLVAVHDHLHAHHSRLYVDKLGQRLVCTLMGHFETVGKFRVAAALGREWAERAFQADWHGSRKDTPWDELLMSAFELMEKHRSSAAQVA